MSCRRDETVTDQYNSDEVQYHYNNGGVAYDSQPSLPGWLFLLIKACLCHTSWSHRFRSTNSRLPRTDSNRRLSPRFASLLQQATDSNEGDY